MALKPILFWKAPDSTQDLNTRVREIRRSIFPTQIGSGGVGLVTPSSTTLNVTVSPFLAQGFDGLTVLSDSTITQTLPVPPPGPAQVYWLAMYTRYQLMQPAITTMSFVPDSTIQTAVDKDYYVRFAKVTVAPGTLNAAAATWDFSVGDHSEQLGQSRWRAPVATAASLPIPPSYNGEPPNHDGDVRVALDTHFAYVWSTASSTWSVVSGAGSLTSTIARDKELDRKVHRSNVGTGLLGIGHNEGAFGDSVGVIGTGFRVGDGPIVNSTATTFNLRVAPFQCAVNGHKIAVGDTTIPLSAPPGFAPFRYDLVYLEVYRSRIVTPVSGIVYDNNIGGTYTFAQIETLIEQIVSEDPYFGVSNFQFGGVELSDTGDLIVTLWKWSVQDGITYTGPSAANYVVSQASPVTVPGFVATTYSAAAHNSRIGIATNNTLAPGIWDGTAYGIPVFVVRRNNGEGSYAPNITAGPTLSGVNIWNLLPMADSEAARPMVRRLLQDDAAPLDCAPGVLVGYDQPLTFTNGGAGGPLTLNIPAQKFALTFPSGTLSSSFPGTVEMAAAAASIQPTAPPVAGARRDFVYLIYWASTSAITLPTAATNTAAKAFAQAVTLLDSSVQGGRTVYVYGMYVVSDAGASTDETDSFVAVSLPFYETGGAVAFNPVGSADHPSLWVAIPTGSALAEHGIDRVFAMPIEIIHRRNSAAYSDATVGSNFNGSGITRPEFAFAGLPTAAYDLLDREVVDLRHATGNLDLDAILEASMDRVCRGQLNTRLVTHPLDASIAGTSHLCVDVIGDPTIPALTPSTSIVPASYLDNCYYAFSDAVETQVVSWTTDVIGATVATGANYTIPSSGLGTDAATHYDYVQAKPLQGNGGAAMFEVTYNSATPRTTLRIRAPRGAYLLSSMRAPMDFVVGGALTPPTQNTNQIGLVSFAHIHGGTNAPIGTPRTQVTRMLGVQAGYGVGSYDYRISYNYLHDTALSATSLTVNAVDRVGRPTDVTLIFPFVDDPGVSAVSSSSGLASIQVAAVFVYDKPKTAWKLRTDYNNYGSTIDDRVCGLSLAPKRIYNINGVVRGTTYNNISVGPLYRTITKACTGTTQVTILAADFTGETGVSIFGLLGDPLLPAGSTQQVRAMEMSTVPGTSLTVTFDAALPGAGNVSFKVAYTSNENKYWFEVYKTSRGVIGPFTWVSDTSELNISGGGGGSNSVTAVPETSYTMAVQHPTNAQNRFTLGVPNGASPPTSNTIGERLSFLGLWNENSAGAPNYYVTADDTWYAGTNVLPWATGSFGRSDIVVNSQFPSLGATTSYYDTYGPHAFFFGGPPSPQSRSTTTVYATPIPLDGAGGDYCVVVYEGHTYSGIMGDNDTLANRLARLEHAVLPANVGDALIYEAVGPMNVTTAGTGLPYLDWRAMGTQDSFYTAGIATPGYRATYYQPDILKENGVSMAYRAAKLNSERLRPVQSIVDAARWNARDDDSDLVMNFIPGPPSQYCPKPNVTGIDIGSFAGVGPGVRSDYDHSAILTQSVTNDLFMGGDRSGWQRLPTVTIQINNANGVDVVRVPYQPAFLGYWVGYGSAGSAQGDTDILLNQAIGDFWGTGSLQKIGVMPTSGVAPSAGLRLVRTITGGDLTALKSRLASFPTFTPETVGRPRTASAVIARGSQGYPTFRPGFLGPVVNGAEATWLGRPSENLLSGCPQDAGLIGQASIGQFVFGTSAVPLAHQQSGNILFATQGLYYDQAPADYGTYPAATNVLSPQKLWAYRGSAINLSGQVRLLINSGFGSQMLVDVQNAFVRNAGTPVHVGFSADAFELLHRPVRRSH